VKPDTNFELPVGAGPMKVTAYSPQTSMTLEKWDGYWDAANILPGGVQLTNLNSDQTAAGVAALQAGQLDLVLANLDVLAALTGKAKPVFTPDDSRLAMFQICKEDGPLADVNVRKAINKAIDREAINEAVFEGTNEPANQPWPEASQFYDPALADVLSYDLEAAKKLMAESGYPNGAEIDAYAFSAAGSPEVAAVMKQQLEEIGITLNIKPAPNYTTDFLDPPKPGIGITPAIPAGRQRLNQWTGDQLSNACDYEDPKLTALINQLGTVSDSDPKAVELWHQISAIVVNDALHGFVTWGQNMIGYNSDVLGEAQNFPDTNITFPDLRRTWVKN
jgi:ABC-type transport system substrate-binding protein